MKRQRGFGLIEVAIYAGIAVTVMATLAGLVHVWNNYTNGLIKEGYDRGVSVTDAAYKERDNTALQAKVARIKELEDAARETERLQQLALKAADDRLQQEKANVQAEKTRTAAAIATGCLVRRDTAFQGGTCTGLGIRSTVSTPATAISGDNAATACQLSAEAQGSVLEIGTDADLTAKYLAAAQAVIVEYQRVCGVK